MIKLFDHKIKVNKKRLLYNFGRYYLWLATIEYAKFNGERLEYSWLIFDRGDAVAVLIERESDGKICLVEQLRPATLMTAGVILESGGGVLEIVAGTLKPNEDPEDCIHRETGEEVGRKIKNLRLVTTCFMSPGACTEKLHIYLATDAGKSKLKGGGLEVEQEDIQIHWVALDEAIKMIGSSEIVDAKTIVAVQALAMLK